MSTPVPWHRLSMADVPLPLSSRTGPVPQPQQLLTPIIQKSYNRYQLNWSCPVQNWTEVEVELKLRPTVSRPARLGVRHPSGTRGQFFFLLEIFFRQLRVCYFVAPSLTKGRVCNLLLLLVLASVVPLGSALSDERSGLSFVSLLSVSVYSQSLCT
jgi:hypothetical protein